MYLIQKRHCALAATLLFAGAVAAAGLVTPTQSNAKPAGTAASRDPIQNENFPDESGTFSTFSTAGRVNQTNAFFQSLGTNGRTCQTCHQPKFGWTITPKSVREVFEDTDGRDPLFHPNDGTNSPDADLSTRSARRLASSMLLTKGLIRIGLPLPANAEFTLAESDDPYHHASAADFSLFRRPLPTVNLPFLSTVMWDGRQNKVGRSIPDNLASQALDAVNGHAQRSLGSPMPAATLRSIVLFETGLFMAQTYDDYVGWLDLEGGQGGPHSLSQENFYIGINDPIGLNPTGAAFNPSAFTLYTAWTDLNGDKQRSRQENNGNADREEGEERLDDRRAAVARGEVLFNTKSIEIIGVAGLNDLLKSPLIHGTCTTCHDTPNVGNHSIAMPLNIGTADASRRTSDLPLYTLVKRITGETVQTSDPGRALVTGKWADIGKFKGPILRGLPTRAPYFHNGSAADFTAVIEFYDTRFHVGFTKHEKRDLTAFLRTL